MFLREKKNSSGSTSVQIIHFARGKSKVVTTIGCGRTEKEIKKLVYAGKQEIERRQKQPELFSPESDMLVGEIVSNLHNVKVHAVGPELIFGSLYEKAGFQALNDDAFRKLVIFTVAKQHIQNTVKSSESTAKVERSSRILFSKKKKDQIESIQSENFLKSESAKNAPLNYVIFQLIPEIQKDIKSLKNQFAGLLISSLGDLLAFDYFESKVSLNKNCQMILEKKRRKFKRKEIVVVAETHLFGKKQVKAMNITDDNADSTESQLLHLIENRNNLQNYFRLPANSNLTASPRSLKKFTEMHLAIRFVAKAILNILSQMLKEAGSAINTERAIELCNEMVQINYTMRNSTQARSKLLSMDQEQRELFRVVTGKD